MKKLFYSLLGICLIIIVLPQNAFALATAQPAYPVQIAPDSKPGFMPNPISPLSLHQNHYYSVTFRGNGGALVSQKIIFPNLNNISLDNISLNLSVKPTDLEIYQVIQDPQCIRYKPLPAEDQKTTPSLMPQDKMLYMPQCEEYQQPDYFQYGYGNVTYQKANYSAGAERTTITLPKPIQPNSTGSVVLFYSTSGYTEKNLFGGYEYSFKTNTVDEKIDAVQVGISSDSDLYLKGAQGKVDYRSAVAPSELKMQDSYRGIRSPQMDSVYQQIGYGELVKSASHMQPTESYTVTGVYADAPYKLYGKEIGIGLLVFAIFISIVAFIIRGLIIHRTFFIGTSAKNPAAIAYAQIAGLSFIASFIALIYTIVLFLGNKLLTSYPGIYIQYEWQILVGLFLTIISAAIYGVILLSPAIYIGLKKGFWWGLSLFVLTLGWMVFYFILILIAAIFFGNQLNYPQPYAVKAVPPQPMMGTMERSVDQAPQK